MTLTEIVQGLKTTVEGFSTSLTAKLEELNTVKAQCLASVASVAQALADFSPIAYYGNIYIDNINGDDANDGLSMQTPVKTWAAIVPKITKRRCVIRSIGNLLLDTSFALTEVPSQLEIRCVDANNAASSGTLTIVDATNRASYAGGVSVGGLLNIFIQGFDIDLAYTTGRGALFNSNGRFEATIRDGIISRSGTGGDLFAGLFSGHFTVINAGVDPSACGHIIDGVGAGVDPNTKDGITANFTQA